MDTIDELLTRRAQQIFPAKNGLEKILRSGKKLTLYQGFDPSSPNLHIGHLVGLLQLKMFQELGHQVIFLIGDFTGMIGDPTDKMATRSQLSREQVIANAKTYKHQAGKILQFSGPHAAKMKFNSSWLEKISFPQLLQIASHFTVQQMLERDMFQDRLNHQKPIFLQEFLYPVMVTYDAQMLGVDLEIGGNDQLFNMTVGRAYLKEVINKDKYAMTLKLLTDSDGQKIGKTTGNAINLFGDPNDLYGSLMSQPDSFIIPGFELITAVPLSEIATLKQIALKDPLTAKKRLSFEVVKLCHDEKTALVAQAHFSSLFQKQDAPSQIETCSVPTGETTIFALIKHLQLGLSNSHLKRVLEEGGVEYNGQRVNQVSATITPRTGDVIKFGKHTFKKIICV